MKTKDKSRKWMWWFLGIVVALQLYFVRELLAAVQRVADSEHPVVNLARRGVNAVEDMARRPLRRPGSATAR